MIQVTLKQPVKIEEVDAEIIIVGGCAFGFVAPGQPPHVLHVDIGTEMASHGIKSDDLLVAIDGRDTRSMKREEVAKSLHACSHLGLERPKPPTEGDGEDTEPPSDGEAPPRTVPNGSNQVSPFAQGEADATPGGARRRAGRSRSRSRRRDRHENGGQNDTGGGLEIPRPPAQGVASGGLLPPPWHGPPGSREPPPPPPAWHGSAPLAPLAPPAPSPWGPSLLEPSFRPPVAPAAPPAGAWRARPAPENWRGLGMRLQCNETGGVTLVAERVPSSVNTTGVLQEYFGRFGSVSSLHINHRRNEAIITFRRMEDADEALRWPVLNDPQIGLRPWHLKAGRPDPYEASSSAATLSVRAPLSAAASAVVSAAQRPPKTSPFAPTLPAAAPWQQGNLLLETGQVLEDKKKKQELEERRKKLLQGLTDQLKMVMGKINNPQITDKNKESLQTLLGSIKDKITALTPVEKKPLVPIEPVVEEIPLPPTRRPPSGPRLVPKPRDAGQVASAEAGKSEEESDDGETTDMESDLDIPDGTPQ